MKNQDLTKFLLFLLVVFAIVFFYIAGVVVKGFVHGFREAARRGGSPAAIERRLNEMAKKLNADLPEMHGGRAATGFGSRGTRPSDDVCLDDCCSFEPRIGAHGPSQC